MKIENLEVVNMDELNDVLSHSSKIDKENSRKLIGYPSIDKPWLKYYDTDFDESQIPEVSIYQLAYESNKDNLDDVAIDMRISKNSFKKSMAKISYDKFFKRIEMSAKASSVIGIKEDEIVPIILPNVPEARILIYSDSVLGSISYPVSPLMPANQLEQLINENEIKNLFLFSAFYEKYGKVLKKTSLENIILLDGSESLPHYIRSLKSVADLFDSSKKAIFKDNSKVISWKEYSSYGKDMKKIEPVFKEDKVAAIIGTSGTTGFPKGVCLTDRNINSAALSYKNGKFFEDKHFLDALLPSIGYGISILHYQTVSGKKVYLIPELVTDRFPELLDVLGNESIKEGGEINFTGGPVHYINLLSSDLFKSGKLPKTQNLVSGGASLPTEVERRLNKVDEGYTEDGINEEIVVRGGYGLSEDTAVGTYSKRGSYKFGSIGIPAAYQTISIFKPDTDEELSYGEVGEICITGPCVMKEYLNNPSETEKVVKIHSDGNRWIHTKDIGYMDEDGHVFHVERIKNIFMRTGFNVHPSKIAEFINTIPFVKNSAVIGFEHPKEQCVPIAFVELNDLVSADYSLDDIQDILYDYCFKNLEETSVPYRFVIVDSLPINLGGKIDLIRIKEESGIDLFNDNSKVLKKINFNK